MASDCLLEILLKPLFSLHFSPQKIIYTELSEAFLAKIKLTFAWSMLISMPFILYQFYLFIAPGLYKDEKRKILPFMIIGILLFIISALFTYYIIFPNAWKFFVSYQTNILGIKLEFVPKLMEYVNLCIQFIIVFGLVFQLPLLLIILANIKLLNSDILKKFRKMFIVIAFIIAAVITPPDIFSQIALAIPLVLLYEISIMCVYYLEKGKEKDA